MQERPENAHLHAIIAGGVNTVEAVTANPSIMRAAYWRKVDKLAKSSEKKVQKFLFLLLG